VNYLDPISILKKAARMLSCGMKDFIQAERVPEVEKDSRN
jgi:hypothetical protein